ncbi:sperm flagellar protein 2 [Brachyistius frenatus]|uniref:sperm flagellar protein 2 n=1 Tax=Brachyistius frenatus TaxID=100188 RepID=UPI0037E831D3
MSDILCRWLNQELRLSKAVEPQTFAKDFSSGYLIGEILHKYQMQNDFSMFMRKDTSIAKVNNFTRLEPTLQLLEISFNINAAQGLMQEKPGVATRLLYQLYVSLEKKKKAGISGTMMEIMQPAGSASLRQKEQEIFSDRLHQVVKRDADLKLQKISQHYDAKCQQLTDRTVVTDPIQKKTELKVSHENRMTNINKQHVCHQKHNMTWNQATNVQVPRPPPYSSQLSRKKRQQQQQRRKEQLAQTVQNDIAQFETNRKKLLVSSFASSLSSADVHLGGGNLGCEVPGSETKLILLSNSKYIQDIRQRLEENVVACEQRNKRADRFLVEQFKAHEAREEAQQDEWLVKRLTRQTQQEKRLAVQLLQIRKVKEVIRENRLFRERQYQQRREKDFQEALDREAILAQHDKVIREEDIEKELEFCNRMAAERAQSRYKKHYNSCKDILDQIVDLAIKVGEYRLLTGNLIPQKQMREWKELLFSGLPLYEPVEGHQFEFSTPLDPVELEQQEILDNQDYDEYTDMVGEWAWPQEAGEMKLPPTDNNILGHVVQRLRNIVHPPVVEPCSSLFAHFTMKACVLGKFCSGKTVCLAKIAEAHGIYVLSTDTLIEEALNAHKNGEVTEQQEDKDSERLLTSSTSLESDLHTQEESKDSNAIHTQEENKDSIAIHTQEESKDSNAVHTQEERKDSIAIHTQEESKDSNAIHTQEESKDSNAVHTPEESKDSNAIHTQEESKDSNARPSVRATQGAAVDEEMRKGNTISNELLVEIIVEAISQLPPQSGWILDGFPCDITQAHLLEKALDGSVDEGNEVVRSRTNLAADPNPPEPPPPPAPVLDLALLLDIPDDCVVKRAYSHIDADADADIAAATTSQPIDKNLYLSQIPHRITAFQNDWPELEKWFGGKQNILVCVDADVDHEELHRRVESLLLETQEALATTSVEDVVLDSVKAPDFPTSTTCSPTDQPPALTDKTLGPTESHSSVSLLKSNTQSPKGHSGNVSPSSLCNEDSQAVTKNPPDSTPVGQVYMDEPLPPDIAEHLCPYWDTVCDSYVNNVKTVMQQLRSQRDHIDHHLFNIRESYKHYLGRPDLKQELVTQWQKDFNSIADDMREDDDTKADLHLRLDGLCECLWDISDKRKEEDEKERETLMTDGWLIGHTAVLVNHHSVLMQVELNRFQETLSILRVYYLSMSKLEMSEHPSTFIYIPLLDSTGTRDHDESVHPSRRPSASGGPKMKSQIPTELDKSSHEKLSYDYEEALSTISKLVSVEAHQKETKENEKPQEKKEDKASSAKKGKKAKPPAKKKKGPPSPPPAPSPLDEKALEKIHDREVWKNLSQEYLDALNFEADAAQVRLELVKGHGLVMVRFLQSAAEQVFTRMKEWLQECYLAEMKSIDQLSEVARHHIEAGIKLQNKLVLECSDFYLNGDCQMVANEAPPPRPPPLEKCTRSTLTIVQLESLHHQLCNIAPSGIMSSSEFCIFLKDVISVKIGRDTLPDHWTDMSETQLMEIVSVLADDCELIDWRQFLLSAALPWPFPSLTELLDVLQCFKATDTGDTGYINEEQYLQTELWFSSESVLPVPEDPTEPLPYDRLANLRKFFFQLFADHSTSPPQLDYVSMLQYFAADLNPRQGFIRALSAVLGQHLRLYSPSDLVKSLPSIGEATELSLSEMTGDYVEEETLCESRSSFEEQEVSIPALLAIISHKVTKMKDISSLPPGCLSQEEHTEYLVQMFRELGYEPEDWVPFSLLSQHPFFQALMDNSTQYQLVNIHSLLLAHQEGGEVNSSTVF